MVGYFKRERKSELILSISFFSRAHLSCVSGFLYFFVSSAWNHFLPHIYVPQPSFRSLLTSPSQWHPWAFYWKPQPTLTPILYNSILAFIFFYTIYVLLTHFSPLQGKGSLLSTALIRCSNIFWTKISLLKRSFLCNIQTYCILYL